MQTPILRLLEVGVATDVSVCTRGEPHLLYLFVNIEVDRRGLHTGIAYLPLDLLTCRSDTKAQRLHDLFSFCDAQVSFNSRETAFCHHLKHERAALAYTQKEKCPDLRDIAELGKTLLDTAILDALLNACNCNLFDGMALNIMGIPDMPQNLDAASTLFARRTANGNTYVTHLSLQSRTTRLIHTFGARLYGQASPNLICAEAANDQGSQHHIRLANYQSGVSSLQPAFSSHGKAIPTRSNSPDLTVFSAGPLNIYDILDKGVSVTGGTSASLPNRIDRLAPTHPSGIVSNLQQYVIDLISASFSHEADMREAPLALSLREEVEKIGFASAGKALSPQAHWHE